VKRLIIIIFSYYILFSFSFTKTYITVKHSPASVCISNFYPTLPKSFIVVLHVIDQTVAAAAAAAVVNGDAREKQIIALS